METIGNNDNGNIIPFRNPDEVIEVEPNVMAQLTIHDDNTIRMWVSYEIEDDEQVQWLKSQAAEALTSLYNYLNGVEDGSRDAGEGPVD